MIDDSQTWLNLAKVTVHAFQAANLVIIGLKNDTSLFWLKSTAHVESSLQFRVFLPYPSWFTSMQMVWESTNGPFLDMIILYL